VNPFRLVGVTKPVPKFRSGSDSTPDREQPDSSCTPRFAKKLPSQAANLTDPCNPKNFSSLSGPLLPNEEVDEFLCRGDFILQHTEAELILHSNYKVFHRTSDSWQFVFSSSDGNAVPTDDFTQNGVDASEFT
jgi:hypothetical protein